MSLTLNESELKAILSEVEQDLDGVLKSEKEKLAKGDDEKSASAPPMEESSSSGGGEESSSAGGPPMAGGEESSSSGGEESSSSGGGEAPPMDASPSADPSAAPAPGAGGEEDLESKLAALPFEQLHHLYMAAKQALFAKMPAAGASPSPSPAAAPPAASPSPAPAAPPPAMKAEMAASPANGGGKTSAVKVAKSETEGSETIIADLRAQVEGLTKAVTILAAPLRKAVTGVAHLPKNDGSDAKKDVTNLSKAEITAKLKEKAADASLSKKDREAINGFYDGRVSLEKISHLLG